MILPACMSNAIVRSSSMCTMDAYCIPVAEGHTHELNSACIWPVGSGLRKRSIHYEQHKACVCLPSLYYKQSFDACNIHMILIEHKETKWVRK